MRPSGTRAKSTAGFSLLVFAFFYRERDAFFSSERGMMETLPHKNIEEFSKDVVLTKPSSLEELLLAFSYFMPVIAYVSNYFSDKEFVCTVNLCKTATLKRPKIGFQEQLSLNAGQKYCRMLPLEHSAILRASLSYQLSLRSLFYQILSGRFTQVFQQG